MPDKDLSRKARTPALAGGAREVRKENRLIFAFSPALAPGASVALLALSLTKNQETRLDFEKALGKWRTLFQEIISPWLFLISCLTLGSVRQVCEFPVVLWLHLPAHSGLCP